MKKFKIFLISFSLISCYSFTFAMEKQEETKEEETKQEEIKEEKTKEEETKEEETELEKIKCFLSDYSLNDFFEKAAEKAVEKAKITKKHTKAVEYFEYVNSNVLEQAKETFFFFF